MSGIFASADINAIKSKEFRDTVFGVIDKCGRWILYSCACLSVGAMGALGALEAQSALIAIGVITTSATGVEIVLTKKKPMEDKNGDSALP